MGLLEIGNLVFVFALGAGGITWGKVVCCRIMAGFVVWLVFGLLWTVFRNLGQYLVFFRSYCV